MTLDEQVKELLIKIRALSLCAVTQEQVRAIAREAGALLKRLETP